MENPFADPSVVEAQRAAANAPIEEDNPFAEDVGKIYLKYFETFGIFRNFIRIFFELKSDGKRHY